MHMLNQHLGKYSFYLLYLIDLLHNIKSMNNLNNLFQVDMILNSILTNHNHLNIFHIVIY